MDYKLPSSGCEQGMKLENFDLLTQEDTVKFVSGSLADLDRARELIQRYDLTRRCHVYLSPVFGSIEPVDMVNYMIEHSMNDVRLQIQMHKVIWDPEKRGV
jgi:7-carboxy-7-deazaguanine synthase